MRTGRDDQPEIAVVLIGHGSRQSESNRAFEQFVADYAALRPELRLSHGYIEMAEPGMKAALRAAARTAPRVVAAPLLLFKSNHAKTDLPAVLDELRRELPDIRFELAEVLGASPALAKLAWLRALATGLFADAGRGTTILFVGRGSRDEDATEEFFAQARLFARGADAQEVLPCFLNAARPDFSETLRGLYETAIESLVVVPHLLFAGTLVDRIETEVAEFARRNPGVRTAVARPLGTHPIVLRLLNERIAAVLRA